MSSSTDVRRVALARSAVPADGADMLVTVVLLLILLSVPLVGGRFGRLAELRFRAPWLAVLALALQVLIIEVVPGGDGAAHRAVHVLSYGLLFVFAAVNVRHVPWLWLVALGGVANAIAIVANGGVMPARPGALASAGVVQADGQFLNSTSVEGARLTWLGDAFAVPASWPVSGVFSVGDVLLLVGVALCLHTVCARRPAPALAPATAG